MAAVKFLLRVLIIVWIVLQPKLLSFQVKFAVLGAVMGVALLRVCIKT